MDVKILEFFRDFLHNDFTRFFFPLISFLGMDGLRVIDDKQQAISLLPGDIVLLCSDGVYKSLTDSQIHAMVRDNDIDMNIAADRLTAMALRYGVKGQDNTTVILLRYREEQEGEE